jgi:hypothetical protein
MQNEPTQAEFDAAEDYVYGHEVIYLAGPIGPMPQTPEQTSELMRRIELAAQVQAALIMQNERYIVLNPYPAPMYLPSYAVPWQNWIAQGEYIAGVLCDSLCLLPGWEQSEGCLRELQAAMIADKPVYEWVLGVGMKLLQRGEA